MERRRWPAAAMLLVLIPAASRPPHGIVAATESSVQNSEQSFGFNLTLAKTIVEYASAVYMTDLTELYTWTCSKCNDLIQGFEMRCLIVDVQNCLQAFVGVDHNLNAIIVSIRGTQENSGFCGSYDIPLYSCLNFLLSVQNWIKDMLWKQSDLNYPDMPDAKVHTGFYSSYNNTLLRPAIANAVHKARKLYGDISIIVTGHSMGGALASFCALDLAITHGGNNVYLMTFGQPRVGNAAFASYFAKYVPNTIRVTHEHDIVPHLPPYFFIFPDQTYHHFPREVWEHEVDGSTVYQVCDGSGEDPDCSRSVLVLFWSASDHLTYLGVDMETDDWSTCRIVLGRSAAETLLLQHARQLAGGDDEGGGVNVVVRDHGVQIFLPQSLVRPSAAPASGACRCHRGIVPKCSKRIVAKLALAGLSDTTSCTQPFPSDHAMALSSLFSSSSPQVQAGV
uniref:Fungal lipase-type domain-containing protein n=1 Tax=Oryza glumipatula TaxID=40148 RepID=A0A0D9Z7B2_9ORYZ